MHGGRTLAKEEPSIVSLALAPGKVDTDVGFVTTTLWPGL
jgi:hypothetical protein